MSTENNAEGENFQSSLTDKEVALYGAMIIGQARVYDVLLVMLSKAHPQDAVELRKMHEEGKLWFPPPAFTEDEPSVADTE